MEIPIRASLLVLACAACGEERPAGPGTCYRDADGDGYGDFLQPKEEEACSQGYVLNYDDCDDGDPRVYARATEICGDDIDQDCTGYVDDALTDADGDGYVSALCDGGDDCDDAERLVHPGVDEICADGVDQDCDGRDSHCGLDGDISLSDGDLHFEGEDSYDELGQALATAGDVDADGMADLLLGAPGNDEGGNAAGKAYLFLGRQYLDGWGDRSASVAFASWSGRDAYEGVGGSLSSAGDVDGDGLADLLLGAQGNNEAADNAGQAFLVLGASITVGPMDTMAADARFVGQAEDDYAGRSVSSAGDVDGDGFDELLVGAHQPYDGTGMAYLFRGPVTGVLDVGSADLALQGEAEGDRAGAAVAAAGDVDGDGLADLLVGAPKSDSFEINAGIAYLMLGASWGQGVSALELGQADMHFLGEALDDGAGEALAAAGDMDGDGLGDLLIGASGNDVLGEGTGQAYLVLGASCSSGARLDLAGADAILVGAEARDEAGAAVAGLGDVDGDGWPDLLVGAPQDSYSSAGETGYAALIYGPVTGVLDLSLAAAFVEDGYSVGAAVAAAGDVDGDGLRDLLVGGHGDNEAALFLGLDSVQ